MGEINHAQNDAPARATEPATFDYHLVEEEKRLRIQRKAEAIKVRMQRTAEEIIAIGQDLLEVKRELAHGLFQKWLQAEFAMSESAATKFMQVATRFGGEEGKSVIITDLPATILYALAAPSTPEEIVQGVLSGEIPADAKAIKEAKEAQQQVEITLSLERKERSILETRLLNVNYQQQILEEDLKATLEERDRLKRTLEGGLEAYYAHKLEMKAENTFLSLLTHGLQKLAEIQQYADHIVSPGMLREVRRLGEASPERFLPFLAQLRETSRTLYETEIKLTGPLKDESQIVDQDSLPNEETEHHP